MQKTNQSQVYLEDSRVRINCSIASQTSQDSQHAVLWYVKRASGSEADELLLRIERSGAFEYGAYADEERLRRRVQAERLSPRLYVLTLNRAENSDSGTYYCLVEEWLSDPDGAWYRLARESSGFTQVLVKQPGEQAVRSVVVFNKMNIYALCRKAAAASLALHAILLYIIDLVPPSYYASPCLPLPTRSAQGRLALVTLHPPRAELRWQKMGVEVMPAVICYARGQSLVHTENLILSCSTPKCVHSHYVPVLYILPPKL